MGRKYVLLLYTVLPGAYRTTCLLQMVAKTANRISLQEYWPLDMRKITGKKHPHNSQQYPVVLPRSPNGYLQGLLTRGLERRKFTSSPSHLLVITNMT